VKLKTALRRPKPDTSRKLTVEPSGFVRNEWLETLSRIRLDQPGRYAREVSAGLQVTVSKYEEMKAEHGRQPATRAAEGKDAEDEREGKTPAAGETDKKKPKRRGGIDAPPPSNPQGTVRR
jgi:hypothetical protein